VPKIADHLEVVLLAQYGGLQHYYRHCAYPVPRAYHLHIADEFGEENHHSSILRSKVTVSFLHALSVSRGLTICSDIIATAIQTAYLYGFSSPNPTQDLWKWTLVTQIIECVTILTSCVPYLRPLLESLPSGLYGSDELRRRGTPSELGYSRNKSGSYQLSSSHSNSRSPLHEKSQNRSHSRKSQNEHGIKRFLPMLSQEKTTHTNSASGLPGGPRRPDGETGVQIVAVKRTEGEDKKWETDSTESRSKILKTTVVSAEWEEVERTSIESTHDKIEVLR
jgi:hypothetical protein